MFVPETLCNGLLQVEGELGRGDLTFALRAVDVRNRATLVLKVLNPDLAVNAEVRDRFRELAVAMAEIRNENVVAVYDVLEDGPFLFAVEEYATGGNVGEWLKHHGAMMPADGARVVDGMLRALEMSHWRGIAHGAIRPSNILVDARGIIKVDDFGKNTIREILPETLAEQGDDGHLMPGQIEDPLGVGPRADLYAAGALLYKLVSGRSPAGLHEPETRSKMLFVLPEEIAGVVLKATSYNPVERYATAAVMRADLLLRVAHMPPLEMDAPSFFVPREPAQVRPLPKPAPPKADDLDAVARALEAAAASGDPLTAGGGKTFGSQPPVSAPPGAPAAGYGKPSTGWPAGPQAHAGTPHPFGGERSAIAPGGGGKVFGAPTPTPAAPGGQSPMRGGAPVYAPPPTRDSGKTFGPAPEAAGSQAHPPVPPGGVPPVPGGVPPVPGGVPPIPGGVPEDPAVAAAKAAIAGLAAERAKEGEAAKAKSNPQLPIIIGVSVAGLGLLALIGIGAASMLGTSEPVVTIDGRPSGTVFVDGTYKGEAPWMGTLPPGAHTWKLRGPDGSSQKGDFTVGETDVSVCWDFGAGTACGAPKKH